jgi:hypothetical protein
MLMVAWLCANSPQEMTLRFVTWTKDARSFSHQDRLKAEVAALLSGQKSETPQLATTPAAPRPAAAPIVVETVLKKIDFHPAFSLRIFPPTAQSWRQGEKPGQKLASIRIEPPVPPPRTGLS